jgi:1,4-alpha-glucan branching enzyme
VEIYGSEPASIPLNPRGRSGIWEGFAPQIGAGSIYKYRIRGRNGQDFDKAECGAAPARRFVFCQP